jgi:hypothetical protein
VLGWFVIPNYGVIGERLIAREPAWRRQAKRVEAKL